MSSGPTGASLVQNEGLTNQALKDRQAHRIRSASDNQQLMEPSADGHKQK